MGFLFEYAFLKFIAGRPQDDLTGQLISNGHKDIAFSDYTSTLKAMRKIAHGALKAYGDGLVKLEQSVLEEADALFKRFDKKNGEGFDPMPDLCKNHASTSFYPNSFVLCLEASENDYFGGDIYMITNSV